MDEKIIDLMVKTWHTYDPHATYFMPTAKLDNFIDDLMKLEQSAEMFVIRDASMINETYRQRLISSLEIPTFDRGSKVMFYDVLQKLVLRAFKIQHNKKKVRYNLLMLKVIN